MVNIDSHLKTVKMDQQKMEGIQNTEFWIFFFERERVHVPTEPPRCPQNTAFCVEKYYLFIYACIFLKRFLESILVHLLNIFSTSHIENLLNTYYAASVRDSPETNEQITANN